VFDETTKEKDWAVNIPGLAVENSDEFTLGYEVLTGASSKLTSRFIRRSLRSSFQFGIDPSTEAYWVLGTPGKGAFSFLPEPEREYTALELSAIGTFKATSYRASYVLSRNRGNYTGLYQSDIGIVNPGSNATLSAPHQATNSTGPLPNDHTHVIKLSAFRSFGASFTGGIFATVESGSPVNMFAIGPPDALSVHYAFVRPRGSVTRTPTIWDLNLRFAYDLKTQRIPASRFILDILHVGNPQGTTAVDELAYLKNTGSDFLNPNPQYRKPIAFQEPMMARLGFELSF
jgi:hypothetical protein